MPLTVAFVPGVTPGKWARVWNERMPRHPLTLVPLDQESALAALADGSADAAFLRDEGPAEGRAAIPLYLETPVVVAPKDHELSVLDEVTLADLEGEDRVAGTDAAAVELVAAGAGVAILPQPLARLHTRRDVVARPVVDAEGTRIWLVWNEPAATASPHLEREEFIGIVRGRTANSSRGAGADAEPPARPRPATPSRGPTDGRGRQSGRGGAPRGGTRSGGGRSGGGPGGRSGGRRGGGR